MQIYKDRLPKGLSYALKPSVLEEALRLAQIQTLASLYQWRENKYHIQGTIFAATFSPAGLFIHDETDVLSIRSFALASRHRNQARLFIEAIVLPDFVRWIRGIELLALNAPDRRRKQEFARAWSPSPVPANLN